MAKSEKDVVFVDGVRTPMGKRHGSLSQIHTAAMPYQLIKDGLYKRLPDLEEYRNEFANPYRAAGNLHIDDVIEPAETRPRLIEALELLIDKKEERPPKKHGIIPT